jgi:hypothetical protein
MSVPMASSVPSSSTKTVVILDKPSDWHEWISIINKKTRDAKIEKLVDVDALEAPKALKEPEEPLVSAVNEDATTIYDLKTPSEQKLHQIAVHGYEKKLAVYEKKVAALMALGDHILATVTRQNLIYAIDKETPWHMLTALKLRVAPLDRVRCLELIQQYRELQKAPRAQQIDGWLLKWERTYTEAVKLALPNVQDDRATYDFLQAIKGVDSQYTATHEVLISEKIKKNEQISTVHNAVADYRNHLRLNRVTTKSSSYSAFAFFNGEQQTKSTGQQNKQKDSAEP